MKVLLLSNPYIESTLINVLDDLLPYEITQVILLEENHIKFNSVKCRHEVVICSDLDTGLKLCEFVLLVKYPKMNLLLENKIINYCNNNKRQFKVIEDFKHNLVKMDNNGIDAIKYSNTPVILLLAIGDFNQHLCIEILLNRIFKNAGVNTLQIYSDEAENLLRQLTPAVCEKRCNNYEIIIHSIIHNNINDVLQNENLLKIFRTIKVDFTIVNIESGLHEKCDVDTMIKNISIRYNTNIDMIISSNYCSVKDNQNSFMPIYYNKKQSDALFSIDDWDLDSILKRKIITKITLPNDVKIL